MADDNSKIEDERTLAKIIADKGILSVKDAAAVTLQIAKVVSKLHAEGKIHRKICADTVCLNKDMSATLDPVESNVVLGGIGIDLIPSPSQLHNSPPLSLSAEIDADQQILTEAGILLNPRQIDFYQLGALLCFMVSGHNVSDYLRSCKAKADVPEMIRPIIDRALGMNTKEQFESTEIFISELESIISGEPATKDQPDLPDSIFIKPSSKPETEEQLPFKNLGHYEIIKRIGHGGMGDVYKAYEKALDRFVAIKVLPAELARQKDFVKRFHVEATTIAQIDHPNIVRIYYSGEDQGNHYFAMQYIDGESLADLLTDRKKLSASEALPIIEQCLAGIGAAHKSGLVHRDIKPGNVLLDRHTRRALIADFGVVKSNHNSTQITITGTIMGTADYIAPEQACGSEVDCRTDLYAMGVLMYQMLSGKLPFDAKSATSMMFQHAYEPPLPLSQIAPDVPEHLATVVMKLMAKKPEDRYQSADEVLCELRSNYLRQQITTSSRKTGIIEAPFYSTPDLPHNLSKLTGKNWASRLLNRITDFFGMHAPQVIEYMQTTGQQVDNAVAEYQRQRDKLAELAKEADATVAEFRAQAKASRKAAEIASGNAKAAKTETAKQQALKEKQENEQAAAELAQLAAEQAEQSEEIGLRLAKLNSKLAQLRSQRDALSARMNAAKAYLKSEGVKSNPLSPKRKIVNVWLAILLFGVSLTLIFLFMSRSTDTNPVNKWQTVDFVKEIEYFKPGQKQWTGNFYLEGLSFYKDGRTSGPWTWEKDWLWHPGDKTKSHYFIKQIDGSPYLFMEWMSGDVTIRGQKPSYYVMQKTSNYVAEPSLPSLEGNQIDNGMIAHWKFDEDNGNIAHDSVGKNNGVIHGATWTDGQVGDALSFDGDGDYVDCGSDLSLDVKELTWALWIKRSETTFSNERALISTVGGDQHVKGTYGLQIDASGNWQNKLQFVRHGDSYQACLWSQKTIEDTNWHHVAVTRNDKSQAVIYIDGVADIHSTVAGRTAFEKMLIGAGNKEYSKFNGLIDEVRIYNRALSAQEILQLYRSHLDGNQIDNGMIAYWKFNEDNGNIAHDSVGKNNGVIHGAKWISERSIADSENDFSNVQGENNWYYGYYDGDSKYPYSNNSLGDDFEEMENFCTAEKAPFNSGDVWNYHFGAGGTFTCVGQKFMHPDGKNKQWAVRRWVSSYEGNVIVEGNLSKFKEEHMSGDGLTGHILLDGIEVWNGSVDGVDISGKDYSLMLKIRNGSVLDFAIDPGPKDDSWDDHASFIASIKKNLPYNSGNTALQFNGKDSYVMIRDSEAFDFGKGNFSISAWFKTNIAKDQFIVRFNGANKCLETYVNSESFVGSYIATNAEEMKEVRLFYNNKKYNDGQWHHIAITMENGADNGYRLFIDGAIVGSLSCSESFSDWSNLTIGGNPEGAWNKHFFNGLIDDVQIYNRALSVQEIQQLYQSRDVIPSFGSNIIIPGVGIGDFRLGMSKEDVIKAMGTPKRIFNVFMIFDDISFGITNDMVRSITALGPSYKFANGLTVGDPQQKVIETFGDDYELEHFDFKDFMRYKDKGLVFEIRDDNKTVMEIEVISKPGTSNHYMALREAAENGHPQTVETFINEGADVNTKYDSGYTPLHLATKNGHIETSQMLISKGADVNAKSKSGETPLHLAAKNGHSQTVQTLIDNNADINAKTNSDKTPLQLAIENGHSQTAQVLIAKGAKASQSEKLFDSLPEVVK